MKFSGKDGDGSGKKLLGLNFGGDCDTSKTVFAEVCTVPVLLVLYATNFHVVLSRFLSVNSPELIFHLFD